MKILFTVTVEWLLKGKGEKPVTSVVMVVAETADQAAAAAIAHEKSCFVEKLSYVRLHQLIRGEVIDVVCN
jgi:hypothetical protein